MPLILFMIPWIVLLADSIGLVIADLIALNAEDTVDFTPLTTLLIVLRIPLNRLVTVLLAVCTG